jgi:hypothetical protein
VKKEADLHSSIDQVGFEHSARTSSRMGSDAIDPRMSDKGCRKKLILQRSMADALVNFTRAATAVHEALTKKRCLIEQDTPAAIETHYR